MCDHGGRFWVTDHGKSKVLIGTATQISLYEMLMRFMVYTRNFDLSFVGMLSGMFFNAPDCRSLHESTWLVLNTLSQRSPLIQK